MFSIIYGTILPIDFHILQDGYCNANQHVQPSKSWVFQATTDGRSRVVLPSTSDRCKLPCVFFHLILLVLSHMSLKKYYLPMILNISSNGGIHRFIIDKLIFSCLCWFDHLCRPFCMQVVTKDDATPSFTAGSLLPSGAVDDIPSSRLT